VPSYAAAPAGPRWYSRRISIWLAGVTLLIGCVLGGCLVGVAAFVTHIGDRGPHLSRDDGRRFDGPGMRNRPDDGGGFRPGPGRDGRGPGVPPTAVPSAPVPVPSTSS
jgi:hypothetical protein